MRLTATAALLSLLAAAPVMAQEATPAAGAAPAAADAAAAAPAAALGDAAVGEKEFNKCKACHAITAADGTAIVKGGKTGPDLAGVIGREIASVEGFKYGEGILSVREKHPGGVWDVEAIEKYVADPTKWVEEYGTDPKAKSKMTFKLNKNQADVAAYLLSVSPGAPEQKPDGDAGPAMPAT